MSTRNAENRAHLMQSSVPCVGVDGEPAHTPQLLLGQRSDVTTSRQPAASCGEARETMHITCAPPAEAHNHHQPSHSPRTWSTRPFRTLPARQYLQNCTAAPGIAGRRGGRGAGRRTASLRAALCGVVWGSANEIDKVPTTIKSEIVSFHSNRNLNFL